jgi:vaccinia related kinase
MQKKTKLYFFDQVEPHSNGPLFVEIHFYLQATRADQLESFRTSRGIHHLGVPR